MPADTRIPPVWHLSILPLAVAQTVVWASIFYCFAGLLARWEADLGWTKTELALSLTLALFASAFCAPIVGRLIDRGHGRKLLSTGPVIGAGLLVLLSMVDSQWQFIGIWVAMGVAMSMSLYEPCFAFLTHHYGAGARRPITHVTLFAGFAGTLSFPLAFAVAEAGGWRASVLVFAGLALLVVAPLTWFATGRIEAALPHEPVETPPAPSGQNGAEAARASPRSYLMHPLFWLIGVAFAAVGLSHGMIINHLMPLLQERQLHPETVVLAASMIGPMQVVGRIVMVMVERHVSMVRITLVAFLSIAAGSLALLSTGAVPELIVAFVVLHGAGIGVMSITRPVVTAELLGRKNFGAISGGIASLGLVAFATAPLAAAGLWQIGGYSVVISVCLFSSVAAVMLVLLASRVSQRRTG